MRGDMVRGLFELKFPTPFRRRAWRLGCRVVLASLVCCASLTLASRNHRGAVLRRGLPSTERGLSSAVRGAASSQASPNGPVHVVTFTLYDKGIEPEELHTRPGLIVVAIEDLSGGSAGLVVQAPAGTSSSAGVTVVGQINRQADPFAGIWRGRAQFQLTAGRYQVYDQSRPSNQAVLIVEP